MDGLNVLARQSPRFLEYCFNRNFLAGRDVKYLSRRTPSTRSLKIGLDHVSHIYGVPGLRSVVIDRGSTVLSPYTAEDEASTTRRTPVSRHATRRLSVALTLASWDAYRVADRAENRRDRCLMKNGIHAHKMSFKTCLPDEIKR